MRISGLYLKNIHTALAHRIAILERNSGVAVEIDPPDKKENIWGEGVKVVTERKLKPKLLTPAQKDELAEKYVEGMSMCALAREYGCHNTTVSRILRQKGVDIR